MSLRVTCTIQRKTRNLTIRNSHIMITRTRTCISHISPPLHHILREAYLPPSQNSSPQTAIKPRISTTTSTLSNKTIRTKFSRSKLISISSNYHSQRTTRKQLKTCRPRLRRPKNSFDYLHERGLTGVYVSDSQRLFCCTL